MIVLLGILVIILTLKIDFDETIFSNLTITSIKIYIYLEKEKENLILINLSCFYLYFVYYLLI